MAEPVCEGDACKLPQTAATPPTSLFTELLKTVEFLPPKGADGTSKTTSSRLQKENKIIGLYFSAQWCPPCRAFSPELSRFAKEYEKDFAVIYVPLDRSQEQMASNLKGKHFHAVPYGHSSVDALSQAINLMSIPTLAILSPDGKLLTTWGRASVTKNYHGAISAWREGKEGVTWLQMLKFWK